MDKKAHLRFVQADSARVGKLCGDHADLAVPSCPGWLVRDAVVHLGFVHRVTASRLRRLSRGRDDRDSPTPPAPADLARWFGDGVAELLDAAARTAPEATVWNWSGHDQTAGFWFRRMAHETVIHRWDVEAASLALTTIDARLAADGVDEFFEVFWRRDGAKFAGAGNWVEVRSPDLPGPWWVGEFADGARLSRELPDPPAAAQINAPAPELLLALWRRIPWPAGAVTGDQALLDRFLAVPNL